MTCQKEFEASHSTFPIACACLSLRMWQIGSRETVVLVMASAGEGCQGEGSIRVITALPVSRD